MRASDFKTTKNLVKVEKSKAPELAVPDCCQPSRYTHQRQLSAKTSHITTKTNQCSHDKHAECIWRDDKNASYMCACECHKLAKALEQYDASQVDLILTAEVV